MELPACLRHGSGTHQLGILLYIVQKAENSLLLRKYNTRNLYSDNNLYMEYTVSTVEIDNPPKKKKKLKVNGRPKLQPASSDRGIVQDREISFLTLTWLWGYWSFPLWQGLNYFINMVHCRNIRLKCQFVLSDRQMNAATRWLTTTTAGIANGNCKACWHIDCSCSQARAQKGRRSFSFTVIKTFSCPKLPKP